MLYKVSVFFCYVVIRYLSNISTSLGSCYFHLVQVHTTQISVHAGSILDPCRHYLDIAIESVIRSMF